MSDVRQHGTKQEPLDVLIVGAGLSGIDTAYRLRERNPGLDYRIVERRSRIGGTWDLFRYPGCGPTPDIFTLSFPWNPWRGDRLIAQGDEIRQYLEDGAATSASTSTSRSTST